MKRTQSTPTQRATPAPAVEERVIFEHHGSISVLGLITAITLMCMGLAILAALIAGGAR